MQRARADSVDKLSDFKVLLIAQKVVYLIDKIVVETYRITCHILQIFEFAIAETGAVVNLNQDDFKRLRQVVGLNKVVFLVVGVINQKDIVAVGKIVVVNLFYHTDGLGTGVTGFVIKKYVDN